MERSACDVTPDMSYEREGAWQSNAEKIRVDGTKKKRKHEWMCFLHFLVRVYWSAGCCTSQSIAISIPGTWRFKKMFILTKKNLTSPLRTVFYSPNHWKHWMMTFNKNDVSGSSIVPNHWKHWMTAFQQDVTCVSHWWGLQLLFMYIIDFIHSLSNNKSWTWNTRLR